MAGLRCLLVVLPAVWSAAEPVPPHPVAAPLSVAWQDADTAQRDAGVDRAYSARSLHFTVLFDGPGDTITARRVIDRLERAYERIGQSLGAYPAGRISVVLYTLEQFRDETELPEWTIAAYDGRIHLPIRGAPQQVERLDGVLTHELAHAVVASLGGRRVPTWLNEGLATVLERGGADWADAVVARTSERPRLADLHDGFGGLDDRQAQIAYATSAHAVSRLMRLRGAPALVSVLRDLARGTPFDTAFERHLSYRYEDFQASIAR